MTDLHHRYAHALTDRQGLQLASHLHTALAELEPDTLERLRAAREQALAQRRRPPVAQRAPAWAALPRLAAADDGDERLGPLGRLGCALALALLVWALLGIGAMQNTQRARELADIDAALLLDDLPPAAYADPGFVRYLQTEI